MPISLPMIYGFASFSSTPFVLEVAGCRLDVEGTFAMEKAWGVPRAGLLAVWGKEKKTQVVGPTMAGPRPG